MSLKLYRPTPDGLEPSPVQPEDWRTRLRSPLWKPARLANPEASNLTAWQGVFLFGGLATLTFAVIVVGYIIGFWG